MDPYSATFRDRSNGDQFRIRFEWQPPKGSWWRRTPGYFRLFVEQRPACQHPLRMAAHLLQGEEICVRKGFEPRTLERAKAIAMFWLRGFGLYRRTGVFPNDGGKINVVES